MSGGLERYSYSFYFGQTKKVDFCAYLGSWSMISPVLEAL